MTDTQVAAAVSAHAEVTFHRHGTVGRIVLNRPKALNALTTPMIEALHRCLNQWECDPGSVLVLESSSPKAFCAGGDIRAIRQNSVEGRHHESISFFTNEYALNARLAELQTPVVSLIDGICMGGGLGLSVHGAFRVLTERAVLAMPETAIGFFPDVGASYFLSRLPGALGTFIGLTGYRLDTADALYTGLGTHIVADATTVASALAQQDRSVDEVLRNMAPAPPHDVPPSRLASHRAEIDHCFGQTSVAGIRSRLEELAGRPWARDALAALDAASPLSLEVTLAAVTAGKQLSLRQCLAMELKISSQLIRSHDFIEGVRAMLVDKDRSPHWADPGAEQFDFAAAGLWNPAVTAAAR
ncbi:enoyl-CoA hydratase/isomerase family protein [Mycolicibacterium goodii]|uniref:enoyl-CoA hydratase/isomerase family protein n=1 Tax=Mycolicibacterium goodii TaxID=134601 RepID=UPI001BDC8BC6|nr:enoyl-CoA hydratase/isomerase family protein [Mycolicibacterium goodii]MBU8816805.1 enoyl-CoA hydratase/isomerase family protein [Mycolicibacterium goodii]MBU8828288.1 enoyl-CoA hydratase/isomerase family protein [Mycolicibacterium goodii]